MVPPRGWTYSPVPEVESAIHAIRLKYPASYPEGLGRLRLFLERLGSPHRHLPFVFHAAGTNGKGSTLAFLQAVFEAGGLSVHKYISPHLVRFEERIILGGRMIEPDLLLSLMRECEAAAGGASVSFFEFFTALAFLAYARHPAEALLLETGLGGRHDATNVVDSRLVSVLTRISHDHVHVLGATLPEIAGHKAGIIKPGCPCVIAPQSAPEVLEVFEKEAKAAQAPLRACGRDWEVSLARGGFEYRGASGKFYLPLPRLVGRHQIDNAGAALAALEASPCAHLLKQEVLERAMLNVSWPGRLQRLEQGPLAALLPQGWELWLDGAHNDSGAEILAQQAQAWGDALPLHLVTAMKRTKDARGFYQPLLPYAATVQAVDTAAIEAPMTPAAALRDQLRQMGYKGAAVAASLEEALLSLVSRCPSPQRVLITGSLYLVGQALKEQ